MNILDEQDRHNEELHKCKMIFLANQNSWMAKQKEFINMLIYKYKKIIELSKEDEKQEQIKPQHQEINKIVQQKIQQYHQLKKIQYFQEQDMNIEQLLDLVQSFQSKIVKLQQEIKHRQNQLQQIQEKKVKQQNCKIQKNQSKWLNNIQSYRKLIQKIRSDVAYLKQKKKNLQNKIVSDTQNGNQAQENNTPIKSKRQNLSSKQNQTSTFEKVLLVFKKKKYENQVLEQRIKQLQNKIAVKTIVCQKIKKQTENMEWKYLQGLEGGGNGYIDSNYEYDMSVIDKSFCAQNMQFSFDISRFIKPKRMLGPF